MHNFEKKYQQEVAPQLMEKFELKNKMAVPRIFKVAINAGVGKHSKESAYIENVVKTLTQISGQKPVLTKAKQAISNFKIRAGAIVGVKVTLRREKMWDFIEKLVKITFPRIRDFRGLPESIVDNQGNLSIGFRESSAFPEVKADELEKIHGLEITIVTNAGDHKKGLELFKLLGFPFKQKESKK